MQSLRYLGGFALLSVCLNLSAVENYHVKFESSIEESWRWTELEAFSGIQYYFADEATNGDIWFAGTSRMVIRYNGSQLDYFNLEDDTPVRALLASVSGDVFVLTDNRLLKFVAGSWESVLDQDGDNSDLFRIGESSEGIVWVSAFNGFYRIAGNNIEFFETEPSAVSSMVVDTNGKLWISQEDSRELFVYELDESENSLRLAYSFEQPGSGQTFQLYLDPDGKVWVRDPHRSGRLYYYEDYSLQLGVEGLQELFHNARAYENGNALRIAALESGRRWMCVPRGLVELDGNSVLPFTETNLLPTGIPCFVPLSNDRLLLGGFEAKTYLIDMSNSRWATYSDLNYQCQDLEGNEWFLEHDGRVVEGSETAETWKIYDEKDGIIDRPNNIFCSSDGTVWISGQHAGMAAVSYSIGSRWERLTFPWISPILSHLAAMESRDGLMVFGSGAPTNNLGVGQGGAIEFRKVKGEWQPEIISPPEYPVRPAIIVERGEEETWYGGAFLWRRDNPRIEEPVLANIFESRRWTDHMVVDSNGDLWIAAWGFGVYQLTDDEKVMHSEEDGLATNQVINMLASESMGGLWVSTSLGLSRFDGQSWSNWDQPYGEFFNREGVTLREGEDGSFWFNQSYRAWLLEGDIQPENKNEFRTYRYQGSDFAPQTKLDSILNQLPEGSPIVASWTGWDHWSETPPDEMEYSWRMDNGDWSPFSRATSTVLSGIKAGEHVFEVRARDRDWNIDPSPASITVYMIPPLWKRTWFILLVVTTVLLILFLLERLFKARVRSALAMEEFKLEFFTNISHELRNPLAVILGPLESLLQDGQPGKSRTRLRLALRNARKMQALVDQLLQFRKVELGKSSYRPATGELIGFIKDAVMLHEPLWIDKDVMMTVDSNMSSFVCAYDSDKLQKIVDNLVSNAIKYSDEGGDVQVTAFIQEDEEHKDLNLVVEDQGPGIPLEKQSLVLNPFYRVRKGKDNKEGFGIGLALVSGLVQVWGGEIDLTSPLPGSRRGTRFTVRLPLDEAGQDPVVDVDVDSDSGKVPAVNGGHPSKVLIVDDSQDLRIFLKDELGGRYTILEAGNGQDGLDIALNENPELIVTDVMMPEMDGMEFCRQLRANPETSHVPIIMLTAKSSEKHSIEGVEAGADVFFPKPVNMTKLVAQIESLLELRNNMRKRFSEQLVVEPTELEIAPAEQLILQKAIEIVESNMSDPEFDVDHFAREMGMGRTALLKKLKSLTGEAPGSFIRSMRLKRAAQFLSNEAVTVSETLDYIGIEDPSYFSRVFKKQFGVSPSQYAKRDSSTK